MPLLCYYLIKVIICSAVLYGYYILLLRNKAFHNWNRFYLLASVVLSLILPLIKIDILPSSNDQNPVVKVIEIVSAKDHFIKTSLEQSPAFHAFNWASCIYVLFYLICGFAAFVFIQSIYSVWMLIRHHTYKRINNIRFISTAADGTPFSFFNYVFWNNQVDPDSETGRQIFQHELVHIQEKHSLDKLFMQFLLIAYWINPFFWLMKKELEVIHEFIADNKSVGGDTGLFAMMVLQISPYYKETTLGHSFFSSSLKRRWLMVSQKKRHQISYFSRLLSLVILSVLFIVISVAFKEKIVNAVKGPAAISKSVYIPPEPAFNMKDKKFLFSKSKATPKIKDNGNLLQDTTEKGDTSPTVYNYRDDANLYSSNDQDLLTGDTPEWIKNRKPETQVILDVKERRQPVYPELTSPRKIIYPSKLYNEFVIGAPDEENWFLQVNIYDDKKNLVQDDKIHKQNINGFNLAKLDFSRLQKGTYLVNIESSDEAYRQSYRLIKDY